MYYDPINAQIYKYLNSLQMFLFDFKALIRIFLIFINIVLDFLA